MASNPEIRHTPNESIATNNTVTSLDQQSQQRISEKNKETKHKIKKSEFESEISEFLESKNEIVSLENKTELEDILFNQYFEIFKLDPTFSLQEIDSSEFQNLVENKLYESRTTYMDRQSIEDSNATLNVKIFVDTQLQEGLTNEEIISQILEKHESGDLEIPSAKLVEYKNFIELLNRSEIPEKDKEVFSHILNNQSFDISEPGAFERFARTALNSGKLSHKTVKFIEEKYHFEPIKNGSDLKQNLTERRVARRKIVDKIKILETELSSLEKQTETLKDEISALKSQLKTTSISYDERLEIENECEAKQEQIAQLEEQEQALVQIKRKETNALPSEALLLPNTETKLEGEIIKMEIPDSNIVIDIPIMATDRDVSKMYNASLVYCMITKYDPNDLVFPDENLEISKTPSSSLMEFSNQILDMIGISENDELMTDTDIKNLEVKLDVFRNQDTRGNAFGQFDFARDGLITNDVFDRTLFLSKLGFKKSLG